MVNSKTTFFDSGGNRLGDDDLLPIPWFLGMAVTFEGTQYTVEKLEYVYGHDDEKTDGLHVTLKLA